MACGVNRKLLANEIMIIIKKNKVIYTLLPQVTPFKFLNMNVPLLALKMVARMKDWLVKSFEFHSPAVNLSYADSHD